MNRWCVIALLLLLVACGEPPTPEQSANDLAARLASGLPAGWMAGRAGDAGVPLPAGTEAEDLLVWKPGPVAVLRRPGQDAAAPATAVLAFPLLVRPWIDPAEYPARRRAWQAAAQAKADLDAGIAQIPRAVDGSPMPRSALEEQAVARWRTAVATLPATAPLPTHHSGRIAVLPIDSRAHQVPEDRDLQREQNLVFGRIGQALTRYPDGP